MKIINDVDFITTEQIQACINLLHPVYYDLVNKIHIYHDWESFYGEHKLYLDKNENGSFTSLGAYDDNLNNIYVLSFNYKVKKEFYTYQTISVIYHELRHAWQYKYKPDLYHKYDDNYIVHGNGYVEQWTERDAILFEYRMYFKYIDELYKIFQQN